MENFQFYSPTRIVFGKDTEDQVGSLTKAYSKKVLLHYGGSSIKKSGVYDRVVKSLRDQEIEIVELGGVVPNPRLSLVREGIKLCRDNGIDFVLAVGGGSVIDSAKAIAIGVPYEGDVWDFFCGRQVEKALPVGVVLTIPAAGSEASPNSVITNEDGWFKRGMGSDLVRPVYAILNPVLTYTLPGYQTACGAADIMAHIMERYFTHTKNVELTDRLCEATLKTMINNVPIAFENPDDYNARAEIMWAGKVAHFGLLGTGRAQDWASHEIEHEISGIYDVAHGAGLAVVMPSWMEFVMSHDVMRFARMATRVFGCQMNFDHPEVTAKEGIYAFRSFLKSIGMPINFESLGAKASDIPTLVHNLGLNGGKTGGFVSLSEEDVASILQIAVDAK